VAQGEQEVAVENEFSLGADMYVPGRQHPERAVLAVAPEPRSPKAFKEPDKESHAPPHNVRLNPLL